MYLLYRVCITFCSTIVSQLLLSSDVEALLHRGKTSLTSCENLVTKTGNTFYFPSSCHNKIYKRETTPWSLSMAKRSSEKLMSKPWLPGQKDDDDDIFGVDEKRELLEKESIQYLASLIECKLRHMEDHQKLEEEISQPICHDRSLALQLAHDRFRDLTCTLEGERALEKRLFVLIFKFQMLMWSKHPLSHFSLLQFWVCK